MELSDRLGSPRSPCSPELKKGSPSRRSASPKGHRSIPSADGATAAKEEEYHDDENPVVLFLGRFVMPESSMMRKVWEFMLLIMLLYIALIFPYTLAFDHFRLRVDPNEPCAEYKEPSFWYTWEWIVVGFFWVDLVVNFFLTYRTKDHKNQEVRDIRLIAANYLRLFFWINLLACLPAACFEGVLGALPMDPGGCTEDAAAVGNNDPDAFSANTVSRMMRLQRATKLARLARLVRIAKIAHVAHGMRSFAASFNLLRGFRIVNWLAALGWVNHMLACGWYLVAAMHTDHQLTWVASRGILEEPPFVQWLHSFYFILTVFTTVGFGDMSAHTVGEILYVMMVMIVGAVVHSIIIGEVINLVHEVDRDTVWKREQTILLDSFGDHTSLPPDTKSSLREFVQQLHTKGGSYDRDQLHSFLTGFAMPRKLLGEIPQQLFNGLLLKNKLVTTCARSCPGGEVPPRFPLLLSTHLNMQLFEEEDVVYQVHDHAFNIYFVMDGIFCYVGEVDEHQFDLEKKTWISHQTTPKSIALTTQIPMGRQSTISNISSKQLRVRPTRTINPPEGRRLYSSREGHTSSMLEQTFSAWTPKAAARPAAESNSNRAVSPQQNNSNSSLQSSYGDAWLQVDLGMVKKVKGIVMQGHPKEDQWVKKYKVQYSLVEDGPWVEIDEVFVGCADRSTESQAEFAEVPARFVRVLPVEWHNKISARVGVSAVAPMIYSYRVFNKMDFFGEEVLLGGVDGTRTRHATARCDTAGEVLILHKRDLLQNGGGASLLTEFPEFQRALRVECTRRYASRSRMLKWFAGSTERCKFATSGGYLPEPRPQVRKSWAASSAPGDLPETPPPVLQRGERAGGAANYAAYILQVAWRNYSVKGLAVGTRLTEGTSPSEMKLQAHRGKRPPTPSVDFESRVISLIEGLAAEVKEVKTKLALVTDGGRQ
jgi:hypothetical protein